MPEKSPRLSSLGWPSPSSSRSTPTPASLLSGFQVSLLLWHQISLLELRISSGPTAVMSTIPKGSPRCATGNGRCSENTAYSPHPSWGRPGQIEIYIPIVKVAPLPWLSGARAQVWVESRLLQPAIEATAFPATSLKLNWLSRCVFI